MWIGWLFQISRLIVICFFFGVQKLDKIFRFSSVCYEKKITGGKVRFFESAPFFFVFFKNSCISQNNYIPLRPINPMY